MRCLTRPDFTFDPNFDEHTRQVPSRFRCTRPFSGAGALVISAFALVFAALLNTVNKNLEIAAVKRAFNVVLNYSVGKFGFTVTSNYAGKVLKAANRLTVKYSNEPVNRYAFEHLSRAPRELVDLQIDYMRNRKFTPYFQARNVFGRCIVTSTAVLPSNRAEYGDPIYELGVRGVW